MAFPLIFFQVLINLNEANDKATIKNFISNNLPGRQGRRNLERALRPDRIQTLTTQMGDRPDVPNVCIILTSAVASDFPEPNLPQFFTDVCDYVVFLRHGGNKDLKRIPAAVCPAGNELLS